MLGSAFLHVLPIEVRVVAVPVPPAALVLGGAVEAFFVVVIVISAEGLSAVEGEGVPCEECMEVSNTILSITICNIRNKYASMPSKRVFKTVTESKELRGVRKSFNLHCLSSQKRRVCSC